MILRIDEHRCSSTNRRVKVVFMLRRYLSQQASITLDYDTNVCREAQILPCRRRIEWLDSGTIDHYYGIAKRLTMLC